MICQLSDSPGLSAALPCQAGGRRTQAEPGFHRDVQIIVATIAFGMGINKPNVRFILHYDLPKSIESYYQEIGRAGWDGLPAHCLLLYSYGDVHKQKHFIDEKQGDEREAAYQHLNALTRYAESDVCRRVPLLSYFGEKFTTENCGTCDNCLAGEKQQVDITTPAQKFPVMRPTHRRRFGAGHVTDVLMGKDTEKIRNYNHQNLSTYGIGKELSQKQWAHIARQLVQNGLLAQEEGKYAVLRLTEQGYTVLKNKTPILGVLQEEKLAQPAASEGEAHDLELFDILRQKRKALADARRVPPYVIFSDRTLVEMATYYPMSSTSMLKIIGVGQVKFERYGETYGFDPRLLPGAQPPESALPAARNRTPDSSAESNLHAL
jgi:ATP-dependent DNA helicase RecQ